MARNPSRIYTLWVYLYFIRCIFFYRWYLFMGATVGVCGLILFIIGMSMKSNIGMSKEAIEIGLQAEKCCPMLVELCIVLTLL